MTVLNPYLTFSGNCEEAFNFYKSVFGSEFTYVGRFSEMPPQEGMTVPDEDKNKIMHISLPISKETTIMGCDDWSSKTTFGNNIGLSLSTDSTEEADRLFERLMEGGKATMPMGKTFWGSYFGMCTDRYNINWMISFDERPANETSNQEHTMEAETITS